MNEDQESQGEKGGFFSVNLVNIDTMVRAGIGAEGVLAYLVLARGTSQKGNTWISTWGAKGIQTYVGMTYTRAENALRELKEQGYISPPERKPVKGLEPGKKTAPKWVMPEAIAEQDIYLANALVEGIGQGVVNPPLMRIYNEASLGINGLVSETRLDALMVLLHLYRHHDLEGCGGVDPRAGIYREWVQADPNIPEERDQYIGERKPVEDLPGTNAALFEIEGNLSHVFLNFSALALFYVPEGEERNHRFWEAFHTLQKLRFLYEVIQVWSDNPNGASKKCKEAQPLYTLYIGDRHARATEPYLSREIHNLGIKLAYST